MSGGGIQPHQRGRLTRQDMPSLGAMQKGGSLHPNVQRAQAAQRPQGARQARPGRPARPGRS